MKALLLDTETTGLIFNHLLPLDRQPEVIEFYGVVMDLQAQERQSDIHFFIKPSKPVSEEITKITRITNEMLETAPTFPAVAEQIKAAIEGAPIVIAHNLAFDMEALDIEFERLGQFLNWPQARLCSVEQTVHLRGFRLSLTALHEHLFGEPFKESHQAKVDVQAMARCLCELVKRGEL